jgi:M6 family metalloprotease-like protein
MVLKRVIALSAALLLATMVGGMGFSGGEPVGASVAEAQSSQDAQLSGIFAARYGDTLEEDSRGEHLDGVHKVEYVLTDDRGRETELQMKEEVAEPEGGTLELVGERVIIEGTGTSGGRIRVEEIRRQRAGAEKSAFEAEAAVTGSKPAATILCRFADSTGTTPHSPSWFDTLVSGTSKPGIDHFWREVSYNNINLSGSQVFGWYNLPHDRAYYFDVTGKAQLNLLAQECTGVANAQVNFPDYTTINLMFNEDLDGSAWGGWKTLTADGLTKTYGMTWMPPWGYENVGVLGHEMGHSYGLPHSSGPYNQVYDSWWDVMSSAGLGNNCNRDATYGCMAMHTISAHKDKLGWIPASQKYTATTASDQNITIERLGANASGDYAMATIPIGGSSSVFYTLEARRFVGYDGHVRGEAIVIHKVDTTNATGLQRIARVVDPDNNGNPNDAGAMWTPGETFTDSANGIKVRVTKVTANGFSVTINPSDNGGGDTTAPRIQSSKPSPEQKGVSLKPTIEMIFNEEMDRTTLTSANIELYRSGASTPVGATVTPTSDGRSVTLKPSKLTAGKWYYVVLWRDLQGIKDLAGYPLSGGGNYLVIESGDYVYWWFRTRV